MAELFEAYEDLCVQIEETSAKVTDLPAGSKERATEMANYIALLRLKNEIEAAADENELKNKAEKAKQEAQDEQLKLEKKKFWGNMAIAVGSGLGSAGLALLMLKYNFAFGNMMGKDSQNYIREIAKISPKKL